MNVFARSRATMSVKPVAGTHFGFCGGGQRPSRSRAAPFGRVSVFRAICSLALVLAAGAAKIALCQELIDRREQARGAFLATPDGIYRHYCAHCHGDDGTGSGRLWTTELSPSPADLTALKQPKEYLVAVIRDGTAAHGKSNLCPPWSRTITADNVERLAQFILSLRSEPSQPASKPVTASAPARETFPWLLGAALVGEILLLWRMLQFRKTGA